MNLVKLLVFACAVIVSSCATVRKPIEAVKRGGFSINEKNFFYINWTVPHQKRIVFINNIYDGDTITAGEEYSDELDDDSSRGEDEVIRLLGVDTPEIAHPDQGFDTNEPGALEATEFTKKAVAGAKVILVFDPDNKEGVFGRTLALIFYKDNRGDMRCLNWELLKRGFAKENLWATDLLCDKSQWRNIVRLARLSKASAFMGMGRLSLKEKFVYDALEFYNRGVKKFPAHADLRKDLAVLYGKLAQFEKKPRKKKEYKDGAFFHWKKLKGTKYDGFARRRIQHMLINP